MEENANKPVRNPLLQQLRETFTVFASYQPLAVGIHQAIAERLPEAGATALKTALRIHTRSTRYLKAMASAKHRVDLDGNPAGEINDEQRAHAAELLKERFRKERERKAEEAAAKRSQEKLQALAARFGRR